MPQVSPNREAMKLLLQQHEATGLTIDEIDNLFYRLERPGIHKMLNNLRQCGEAHCKREAGQHEGRWFPGIDPHWLDDDSSEDLICPTPTEHKRLKSARQGDRANPIVFCGAGLRLGRCASVWEYAQRHQEQRP